MYSRNSPPEILLLFQDAYLNCFHSLHFLSKKLIKDQVNERKEIWSHVQRSMTELLQIASQVSSFIKMEMNYF